MYHAFLNTDNPKVFLVLYKGLVFMHPFIKPGMRWPQPACAWFLKIDIVQIAGMRVCVCVCVCVSAPEAINN